MGDSIVGEISALILKKLYFNLFGKITDFSIFLALKSITESRVFNIKEMGGPNNHVFLNRENNFQKVQLHQTLTLFSTFGTCQDHSILGESVSTIFKK